MDNHNPDSQQTEAVAESSDRRDFLKKMVVAGAFAAPVVATFARGIRGSKSLQAAAEENIASGALDAEAGAVLAQQGHFLNASARRPAVVLSNNVKPRTKNAALPTTTAPTTTTPTTTTKPRGPRQITKNGTVPPSTTRPTIAQPKTTTTKPKGK